MNEQRLIAKRADHHTAHAMRALLLALILAAPPAWSLSIEQCDSLQSVVTSAMELRQGGVPAQQAIRQFRQTRPTEAELTLWTRMVGAVYELPRAMLTGPERADLLTQLYGECLTWKAGG